jgi:beta-N-acetylhexosaminidase
MSSSLAARAAGLFCVGFPGKTLSEEARELVARGVAGVILFARNVGTPEEVCALTRAVKTVRHEPALVAVDQEGGPVRRLREGFTDFPALSALGASDDLELGRELGAMLGRELAAVGIDWNLAPVLDVDTNPKNPVIGVRSIGSDPERVARLGVAFALALEAAGVASCGKHFPGHGDTELDSHHALPRLAHDLERLRAVELVPFAHAARAKLASIMTAHVLFSAVDPLFPATMSRPVLTGLLREELGYDGLVVSDDLEMKAILDHFGLEEAVVRGVSAGVDLFLVCHSAERADAAIRALVRAVERGTLERARLEAAERRVAAFRARFAAPPRDRADLSALDTPAHRAIAERLRAFAVRADQRDATGGW